jgi:hypothetical protein
MCTLQLESRFVEQTPAKYICSTKTSERETMHKLLFWVDVNNTVQQKKHTHSHIKARLYLKQHNLTYNTHTSTATKTRAHIHTFTRIHSRRGQSPSRYAFHVWVVCAYLPTHFQRSRQTRKTCPSPSVWIRSFQVICLQRRGRLPCLGMGGALSASLG